MAKSSMKNKIVSMALFIVNPFIVPIIIIVICIVIISSITDILYIAFDNEDKVDIKKELAYYDTEYEKEDNQEVKAFFSSVWDFVDKIFGSGEMSEEADWPVKRTIYYNK